jgi:UDP-glucose 4-epimerase
MNFYSETILVTGGLGFIGSNLVRSLSKKTKKKIIIIDNLSSGKLSNIDDIDKKKYIHYRADIKNFGSIKKIFSKHLPKYIFHLAGHADIKENFNRPFIDEDENFLTTLNILKLMKFYNIKYIIFSSTSAVYGEIPIKSAKENNFFPIQTSFYGAAKLASEGYIQAYSEMYKINYIIFRFSSITGRSYSHGHIIDFYNKLKMTPHKLNVLGNGEQIKSYLDVDDCIKAILKTSTHNKNYNNIFNIANNDSIKVKDSVRVIIDYLRLNPKINYQKKDKGWVGDNKYVVLNNNKLKKLGWSPKYNSLQSILRTIKWLNE